MICLRHTMLGHPLGRSCRHVGEGLPSGCMVRPDRSLPAAMQGHKQLSQSLLALPVWSRSTEQSSPPTVSCPSTSWPASTWSKLCTPMMGSGPPMGSEDVAPRPGLTPSRLLGCAASDTADAGLATRGLPCCWEGDDTPAHQGQHLWLMRPPTGMRSCLSTWSSVHT